MKVRNFSRLGKGFMSLLAIILFAFLAFASQETLGPLGCEPVTPVTKYFTLKFIVKDGLTGEPLANVRIGWSSMLYLVDELAYPEDPGKGCIQTREIFTDKEDFATDAQGIYTFQVPKADFNDANEYISLFVYAGGSEFPDGTKISFENRSIKAGPSSPDVVEAIFNLYKVDDL